MTPSPEPGASGLQELGTGMFSEHLLMTRDDGSVCQVAMLRELMSGRGFGMPLDVQQSMLKLQSWLLSTSATGGPTSIPWCACQGDCDLGYSLTLGRPGSSGTATPG